MKLRQKEFCHNCQQVVEFVFDDVTDKQVIYCPKCGHDHYRELDQGTIVNIAMDRHMASEVQYAICPQFPVCGDADNVYMEIPIKTFTRKIVKRVDGGVILAQPKDESERLPDEHEVRFVSDRRFGRSRSQF